MNDSELVQRVKEGDADAFAVLLHRHKGALYPYIVSRVKDEAAACDIFQEVFIRVLKHIDNYEEMEKFRAWLFRIATNITMDHFRRQAKSATVFSREMPETDRLESPEKTPEENAVNRETSKELKVAIDMLSDEQKEIFLLREFSGLSFREIAGIKGISVGAALTRMSRATTKLRGLMRECHE